MFVILSLQRDVAENCALLCYYAASSGNLLTTFRNNLSVPSSGRVQESWTFPEDGTYRLSKNAGKKLPLFAA